MSDETTTEDERFARFILDWQSSAETVPVRHSNQIMVQIHDKEMFLSFFMIAPPILFGTPENIREQAESIKVMKPECIARISIAPHTFKSLIEVLQRKLEEFEEEEAKNNGTES